MLTSYEQKVYNLSGPFIELSKNSLIHCFLRFTYGVDAVEIRKDPLGFIAD